MKNSIESMLPELTPVREAWENYYSWLRDVRNVQFLRKALKIRETLSKEEREELTEMSNGDL